MLRPAETGATDRRTVLIAVLCFIAYLALYTVAASRGNALAASLMYLVVPASALALAVVAWREARPGARLTWSAFTLGLAGLFLGEVLWAWYTLVLHVADPPTPSLIDVSFFAGYALLFVAVIAMVGPHNGVTRHMKARYLLDITVMALTGWALVLSFVVWPAYEAAGGGNIATVLTLAAYPCADIVLIASFAALVLGFRGAQIRPWQIAFAGGLLLTSLGDLGWTSFETTLGYRPGTKLSIALDVAWLLGYCAFAWASRLMVNERRVRGDEDLPIVDRRQVAVWWDVAVPAVVLAALPLLLFQRTILTGRWSVGQFLFVALSFALAAATVVRSIVLAAENRDLAARSVTDPLTGLFNHRFFHERLAVEMARATRTSETLALAVFDLDSFASINNTMGHPIGDKCLAWVSSRFRASVRSADLVCRLGGDEFAVIMPATSADDAIAVSRRLGEAIAGGHGEVPPLTTSVGIAMFPQDARDAEELIRRADGALYWAKHNGRNRILVYDADTVEDLSAEERALRVEEQSYLHLLEVLAAAVDARDAYTQYHSQKVAALSASLAAALGFDERHVALIRTAALLHDVGKIGVSDAVLRKSDTLTEDERAQIRQHPELGQRILCASPFADVLPWILSHHERWDGTGYPNGLREQEIPLEARILAVCDAYDAMVTDRPYRQAMAHDQALVELLRGSGTQFDAEVVRAFLRLHSRFGLEGLPIAQ